MDDGSLSWIIIGVLYLFKRNHNIKQNLSILVLMFLIGAVSGVLLQVIM